MTLHKHGVYFAQSGRFNSETKLSQDSPFYNNVSDHTSRQTIFSMQHDPYIECYGIPSVALFNF